MDQLFPQGLPFMKMHGAGNDFVVIDSRGRGPVVTPALARAVGDRRVATVIAARAGLARCGSV